KRSREGVRLSRQARAREAERRRSKAKPVRRAALSATGDEDSLPRAILQPPPSSLAEPEPLPGPVPSSLPEPPVADPPEPPAPVVGATWGSALHSPATQMPPSQRVPSSLCVSTQLPCWQMPI